MKWPALLGSFVAIPMVAFGGIIAAWDVENIDLDDGSHASPFTIAAHTSSLNMATATISLSTNVNASTGGAQYGFKIDGGQEQTNLVGAITAKHYLEIALATSPDHHMNLTSILMHGESTGTGCDDIGILTSVEGFTSSNVLAAASGIQDITGGFDTDASGFGGPIVFDADAYREITTLMIRIYGWNSAGSLGVSRLRNLSGYDLIINGTVEKTPIPPTVFMVN